MTNEQMLAHATLLGWRGMAFNGVWIGVMTPYGALIFTNLNEGRIGELDHAPNYAHDIQHINTKGMWVPLGTLHPEFLRMAIEWENEHA